MPIPVGIGRFVIRATHERGVGAPSSRSLSTATHEAAPVYRGRLTRRRRRQYCSDNRGERQDTVTAAHDPHDGRVGSLVNQALGDALGFVVEGHTPALCAAYTASVFDQ